VGSAHNPILPAWPFLLCWIWQP